MAITPIKRPLYGPDGKFIPPAPVEMSLEAHWLNPLETTRLPNWLTATGTVAYTNQPAARAGLRITSGTAPQAPAKLAATTTVDTTLIEGIRFDLFGVEFSTDAMPIGMGLAGSSGRGAYISQSAATDVPGGAVARFKWGGWAGDVATKFRFRGDNVALSRRNLSLLALPRQGHTYLLQNDQVVAFTESMAGYLQGSIAPDISITNTVSTAVTMSVQKVRLTVWQS